MCWGRLVLIGTWHRADPSGDAVPVPANLLRQKVRREMKDTWEVGAPHGKPRIDEGN